MGIREALEMRHLQGKLGDWQKPIAEIRVIRKRKKT